MVKPREECGVFAVVAKDPSVDIAQVIFRGLMSLQHRGQEAAGISIVDSSKRIHTFRDHGLVFQALKPETLQKMCGHVGIGHVRYGTAGCPYSLIEPLPVRLYTCPLADSPRIDRYKRLFIYKISPTGDCHVSRRRSFRP